MNVRSDGNIIRSGINTSEGQPDTSFQKDRGETAEMVRAYEEDGRTHRTVTAGKRKRGRPKRTLGVRAYKAIDRPTVATVFMSYFTACTIYRYRIRPN